VPEKACVEREVLVTRAQADADCRFHAFLLAGTPASGLADPSFAVDRRDATAAAARPSVAC